MPFAAMVPVWKLGFPTFAADGEKLPGDDGKAA
jgi:hypothetical protein